jgi:hypothetical protein
MADVYTAKKLAVQPTYQIGSTYQYAGRNATFAGQCVTIVGHETKGGIVIELAGTRATVSPFSLTPVQANGHQTPSDPAACAPATRIIRNGQVLAPPSPMTEVRSGAPEVGPVPVRDPARKPKTIHITGLRASAPTTEQCHALFHEWLGKHRWRSSRDHRQAVIDRFELITWLRDRVPQQPGPTVYKETVYYTAATLLNHPTRMPPPDEILVRIAAKFPQVDRLAVSAHIEWMSNRLNEDHAAFLAHRAAITVEAVR